MKKLFSIILTAVILSSLIIPIGASNLPADDDIETILDVMQIMTFDAKGSFNEGQYVTRAALAKILVTSSQYKGAASATSRISPFADVMYTHWGAPYISIASKNKFMTGYSDGYFRPDKSILYEEALSAILRLLGYTSDDFTGGYPTGQIAKASDIGISDGVNISVGSYIQRSEMAKLIYNMLNTPAKGDTKAYAANLGYSLSSEQLTIGDVLGDNVTGPITVKTGTVASLGFSSPRVYRNGKTATVSDIANYDVIYYSKKSNAIWAYSQKISGLVEKITPNKESPTSVTVSGATYQLPYYAAQRAFGIDGLEVGDTATLLLDKNGLVCDAYEAGTLYESIVGVVTDIVTKSTTASDGTKKSAYYAKLLTLNGDTVEIERPNDSTNFVGYAVTVDVTTSKMERVSSAQAASGYVHSDSRLWGKAPLAQNVKILEMDDNGNILSINLSRLDGVYLKSENVLLVSKNESGAVDGIIIKNVTGDTHKYGIITSVEKRTNNEGALISYSYNYDLGGTRGSVTLKTLGLTQGPCVFKYKDGELCEVTNLIRAEDLLLLTPSYVSLRSGVKHKISSGVLVYRIVDDTKILTTLDEALTYDGTIWAYYDKIQSEGGLIRVIYLK